MRFTLNRFYSTSTEVNHYSLEKLKEKNNSPNKKRNTALPTEYEIVSDYILKELDGKYVYDSNTNIWYQYDSEGKQIWETVNFEDFKFKIMSLLTQHEAIKNRLKPNYLNNVIDFLKTILRVDI